MRNLRCLAAVALFFPGLCTVADAQMARPQFRPSVLRSGPESLINTIDREALSKAGQKDGAVMFSALVKKTGEVAQSRTYRGTPDTAALEAEVRKRLENVKFAPAIYNYQPVEVILSGTVFFAVADGKPQVRIFLNQDPNELKKTSDFIAPQPVLGGDSQFTGVHYPTELTVQVKAVVDLGLNVDVTGHLRELHVVAEEPPLLGFKNLAAKDFHGAKFIPAFRDGDAVESKTLYPVCYQPDDSDSTQPAAE